MTRRWDWFVLGGWVVALVAHRAARLTERDPYWQTRDGLERWSGAPLARPDSWSWALPEGTFRPTSPGWNSALALGYDHVGFLGLALTAAIGMLAYFTVALVVARRLNARPLPALLATVVVTLLALPMISPRATIAIEALLLATLALADWFVRAPFSRRGWTFLAAGLGAALLGWLGSWIHVSWAVTAIGLAVAVPILSLLHRRTTAREVGSALALAVGIVIGSSLGPYGLDVWRLLLDVSGASEGQIIEWLSPFTPGFRARWLPVALICLALASVCAWEARRRARGAKASDELPLEVVLVTTSLLAAVAGMFAIRFLGVAALTLLPVFAAALSRATVRWRSTSRTPTPLQVRLTSAYWRPILTAVLALLLPLALWTAREPGRPVHEAALAGDLPRGCKLFSDPSTSGALLLLRPDVLVWIDMRTEVYGSEHYADARRRLSATAVSVPPDATCAVLPTGVHSVHTDGRSDPWQRRAGSGGLSVWLPV